MTVLAGTGVLGQAYVSMCLLRLRPQDMPASSALLLVSAIACTATSFLLNAIDLALPEALLLAVTGTLVVVAVVIGMLALIQRLDRASQTLSALFGTSVVLFVPAWPLLSWMSELRAAGQRSDVAETLWLLLFVWSLFVMAHIFRNALSTRQIGGFFAALALNAIIVVTSYWVRDFVAALAGAPAGAVGA